MAAQQQQTRMDFIKTGNIIHQNENKILWWVEESGDRMVSPTFIMNKTVKSKLTSFQYEDRKDVDYNGYNSNIKRVVVQLLMSPEAANLIEKVNAILYMTDGRTYLNPENLSYYSLDSSFPMVIWTFKYTNNNNSNMAYLAAMYANGPPVNNFVNKVRVEVEFFYKIFSPITNVESKISNKYEELFTNGKFSDITIDVNGTEFKVHKAILSAQSKVFADMFEDQSKEFKMNRIEISDIHADIMQEILRFIYSGKVKDIEKLAFDLVLVADKYELQDLTNLCQSTMINNITLDNITQIFSLLSYIQLDQLKQSTLQFITKNRQSLKTKEFSDFLVKLPPSLLSEIITIL